MAFGDSLTSGARDAEALRRERRDRVGSLGEGFLGGWEASSILMRFTRDLSLLSSSGYTASSWAFSGDWALPMSTVEGAREGGLVALLGGK